MTKKSMKEEWRATVADLAKAFHILAKHCGYTAQQIANGFRIGAKLRPSCSTDKPQGIVMNRKNGDTELSAGDAYEFKIQVQDMTGPLDLSGENEALLLLTIECDNGEDPIIEKMTPFSEPSKAKTIIHLSPKETQLLAPGIYDYCLTLMRGDHNIVLTRAKLLVNGPRTQPPGMKLTTNSNEIEIDRESPASPKTKASILDREFDPKKVEGHYK